MIYLKLLGTSVVGTKLVGFSMVGDKNIILVCWTEWTRCDDGKNKSAGF